MGEEEAEGKEVIFHSPHSVFPIPMTSAILKAVTELATEH